MAIEPHHNSKLLQDLLDKLAEQSGNSNHENLSGLLGGNASGHHHLTLNELNRIKGYPDFSSLNHESLQGLLGGNSNGHYHLTVVLLNKLINLPANGNGGIGATTENWTFTLDDGSTITKTVVLA